ncbi:MAG: hypothetical protein D6721_03035 [Gammaproteobacteria bacterium]|nr:MAG: hypothetical protein D6721_03035 [Gammaproteobacteria bacterium]
MDTRKPAPQGAGRAILPTALAVLFGGSTAHAVSISEIFYDAVGRDADHTFIELVGRPGESLDGLILVGVNGSNGEDYLRIPLSGILPDTGVYLIADGSAGHSSVPGAQRYTDADLQNGPDSLQLRRGGHVLDAVGYGDFTDARFAGIGTPAPDAPPGKSLTRIAWTGDNGHDFVVTDPSPGIAVPAPVPVPAALWLFGSGLGVLGLRARGRTPTPGT